ncbi:tail fiber domain-containing protein [bacterium]|nr:tail fiber domain-containing protein [bacterium]
MRIKRNNLRIVLIVSVFLVGSWTLGAKLAYAAVNWQENPNSCPASDNTNFPGQSCPGSLLICGDDSGTSQCYDMSTMVAPGSDSAASNTQYNSLTNGGYVVDCYTAVDAGSPYCDNSGNFWCNRDPQCVTWHRNTICKANTFAYQASSYECSGSCHADYHDCDGDNQSCEIHDGDSCGISSQGDYLGCSGASGACTCRYDAVSGTGTSGSTSNHFDCDSSTATAGNGCESQYHGTASCGGHAWTTYCSGGSGVCGCQSGNIDFDDNDGDADIDTGGSGNGCEIVTGEACTMTVGGVSGTCAGTNSSSTGTADSDGDPCECIAEKSYFETGTLSSYSTGDALLWGRQFGSGALITFGNSTTADLFVVNNDGSISLGQIAEPTVTTDKLYNVGGNLYWNGTLVGAGSGGGFWEDGTNGVFEDDKGVIVGIDQAETLENAGFILDIGDMFVQDQLGVEGNIYTDGAFVVGATTTLSDGSLVRSDSGDGNLTISTTGGTEGTLELNPFGNMVIMQDFTVGQGGWVDNENPTIATAGLSIDPHGLDPVLGGMGYVMLGNYTGSTLGAGLQEFAAIDAANSNPMSTSPTRRAFIGAYENNDSDDVLIHLLAVNTSGTGTSEITFQTAGAIMQMTNGTVRIADVNESLYLSQTGSALGDDLLNSLAEIYASGGAIGSTIGLGETSTSLVHALNAVGTYAVNSAGSSFWSRTGTLLSTATGGDNVTIDDGAMLMFDGGAMERVIYVNSGVFTIQNSNGDMIIDQQDGVLDIEADGGLNLTTKDKTGAIGTTALNIETGSVVDGTSGNINLIPGVASGAGTQGSIRFANAYSFPNVDGTNNQVLATDGSGALSWISTGSGATSLWDGDIDTGIQVEEVGDEDFIRFDTFGVERMFISNTGELHWMDGGYVSAYFNIDNPSDLAGSDPSMAGLAFDSVNDRTWIMGGHVHVAQRLSVGISPASLDGNFHVRSPGAGNTSAIIEANGVANDAILSFYNGDGGLSEGGGIVYDGGTNEFIIRTGGYAVDTDIAFQTNSTERMRIGSDGNVAIGTSNTTMGNLIVSSGDQIMSSVGDLVIGIEGDGYDTFFETRGTDMAEGLIMHGGGSGDAGIVKNMFGIGYTSGWVNNALHIFTADTSPIISNINGSEVMRLTSDDRVGIGTTTPAVPLHIVSNQALNPHQVVRIQNGLGSYFDLVSLDETPTAGYPAPLGSLAVVGTHLWIKTGVLDDAWTEIASGGTSAWRQGGNMFSQGGIIGTNDNHVLDIRTNGVTRIHLANATGSGAITFNSAYTFPTVDGTSGQALITDGSGALSWTNVGGETSMWDGDSDTGIQVEETGDEDFIRFDTNSSERMVITDTGQIGIGTAAPSGSRIMHLYGVANTNNFGLEIQNNWTIDGNADLWLSAGPTSRGGLSLGSGHMTLTTYNALPLRLGTNATERMEIAATGAIQFNDAYTFPMVDGTNGQVLQTDGSGTLTWASAGAGVNSIWDANSDTGIQVEELPNEDIIRFDAGGTERMTIDSDGLVTIGGSGTTTDVGMSLEGDSNGVDIDTEFRITTGSTVPMPASASVYLDVGVNQGILRINKVEQEFFMDAVGTNSLVFKLDGTAVMRIDDSTGNIGINAASPDADLDIEAAENTEFLRFTDSTNSDSVGFFTGNATPEGVVTAQLGSLFMDNTGGALYLKDTGDGTNTGWVQVATGSTISNIYTVNGTLTGDRTLNTGGNNLTLQGTQYANIQLTFDDKVSFENYYSNVSMDDTNWNMHIEQSGGGTSTDFNIGNEITTITSSYGSFAGFQYGADYSANFVDRSLVDKGYVDGIVNNVPANNGLTNDSGTIQLGGILVENTQVSGDYTLRFDSTDTSSVSAAVNLNMGDARLSAAALGNTINHFRATQSSVVMLSDDNQGGSGTGISSIILDASTFGTVRTDSSLGLRYSADYSTNFVDRSLVDKGYVDVLVSSVAPWERDSVNGYIYQKVLTDNIGIGTATPRTALELSGDGAILATGTYSAGWTEPDLGAGTRMMWYPRKAAFRAGGVSGTQWDDGSVGTYSTAMGYDTTASAYTSTALGWVTTASGAHSTALGGYTLASNDYATAMGRETEASGQGSTAIGWSTTASGNASTAIGYQTTASGVATTAIGRAITAGINGDIIAIGLDSTARTCNQANSLCIMGGEVGIGAVAPTASLHLAPTTTSRAQFRLETSAGTDPTTPNSGDLWWNGTELYFYDGSTSNDLLAGGGSSSDAIWDADLDTGIQVEEGIDDDTIRFDVGNYRDVLLLTRTAGFAWNDGGISTLDFRIEGDAYSYLFFADVDNNRIGIGTNTPGTLLEVEGIADTTLRLSRNQSGTGAISNIEFYNSNGAGRVSAKITGSIHTSITYGYLQFFTSDGTLNESMRIETDGEVGIGTIDPDSILHADSNSANTTAILTLENTAGDFQVFRADATPESAITGSVGDLAVDGTNGVLYIKNTGDATNTGWVAFGSGGGAFSTTLNVTSNSPGTLATDDFVFGSSQLADDGNTDHDYRMFFDKSKGSFRAGRVTGTQWDDAYIGVYSAAFGRDTIASGINAVAMGRNTDASGSYSIAMSYGTEASGDYSTAMGYNTEATGENSIAVGENTVASGETSTALGFETEASANYSTAMGYQTVASGLYTTSIGQSITAGTNSNIVAIGLDSTYRTCNQANSLCIMGGEVGIGTGSPTALLHLAPTTASSSQLRLETSAGIDPTSPNSGDLWWNGTELYFYDGSTSNDLLAGGSGGAFSTTLNVTSNSPGTLATDDFVFGSSQLADDGNTDHDHRMFFDKSEGSFRAGMVDGTQWDNVNVGSISMAFGWNATAPGNYATALGRLTDASGTSSTAIGYSSTASADYSTAIGMGTLASAQQAMAFGYGTTASGEYALAMGRDTTASGVRSTALGYDTTASGESSTALGWGTIASGTISTAIGQDSYAAGRSSFTGGRNMRASSGDGTFIWGYDDGGQTFAPANSRFLIFPQGDTGMVGIGIVSPSSTLHVDSNAANTVAMLTLENSAGNFQIFRTDTTPESTVTGSVGDLVVDSNNGTMYLKTSGSGTNTGWTQFATGGSGGDYSDGGEAGGADRTLGNTDAFALSFLTNDVERLKIESGGDIDISQAIKIDGEQTLYNAQAEDGFTGSLVVGNGGTNLSHVNPHEGYYNTFVGIEVGSANTIGNRNTANGYSAFVDNTVGSYNTTTGAYSLTDNTTGDYNTVMGFTALRSNVAGSHNTASGYRALYYNIANSRSTAMGSNAMFYADNRATGRDTYNTAVGYEALRGSPTAANNTGQYNTSIGDSSLLSTSSGSRNSALGHDALYTNTTGNYNTAIGDGSLYTNSTGQYNTASGYNALYSNVATGNTATGHNALYSNTSGIGNVADGRNALFGTTTGNYNTAVGRSALNTNTTGSSNTAIGNQANVSTANLTNATAIGDTTTVNASNKVRIGNGSVTAIEGQVAWSYPSDRRLKENIEESVLGLEFINKLNPVTFNYKAEGQEGIEYTGLIAQEVEAALEGVEFSGLNKPQSEDDFYSLSYSTFIVPLINAVQEQQIEIETLGDLSKNEDFMALFEQVSDIEDQLGVLEDELCTKDDSYSWCEE